jgi:hypothetical protein
MAVGGDDAPAVPGDPRVVRAVTVRLLLAFAAGPAGAHHRSRSNLARLGIAPAT